SFPRWRIECLPRLTSVDSLAAGSNLGGAGMPSHTPRPLTPLADAPVVRKLADWYERSLMRDDFVPSNDLHAAAQPDARRSAAIAAPVPARAAPVLSRFAAFACMVYFGGAMILLARLAGSIAAVRQLRGSAVTINDGAWLDG